jgi:large subunit ribosomal protein L33
MAKKGPRQNVKMRSTESSHMYLTTKNRRNDPARMELRKRRQSRRQSAGSFCPRFSYGRFSPRPAHPREPIGSSRRYVQWQAACTPNAPVARSFSERSLAVTSL